MSPSDFVSSINGFVKLGPSEAVKAFAWYLHTYKSLVTFRAADIIRCFENADLKTPINVAAILNSLSARKNPEVLKSGPNFRLARVTKERLDQTFGLAEKTIQVRKLLAELPQKIPKLDEREFLKETITCFRHEAFRSAIVMSWCLAFDHLCVYILEKHLDSFNEQFIKSYPKDGFLITKRDDFQQVLESKVLLISKSAGIITKNLYDLLKEKLDRRNSAAHASSIVFNAPIVEAYISDLIENVVLKI